MLNLKTGNLFKNLPPDKRILIPHICNNLGKWGAGFVLALSSYDEKPESEYRSWHKNGLDSNIKFELGEVQIVECNLQVVVANMVAQNGVVSRDNPIPIKYWALSKAMCSIRDQCSDLRIDEIISPFFGTGLAKGNKDIIKTLINEIWSDIPVTVFEL